MRKAKLHAYVATELAMRGYAPGSYGWTRAGHKVVCRVLTAPDARLSKADDVAPTAGCYVDLHLPAGKTSKPKALAAIDAALPTIGPAKPVARWSDPARYEMQHDMELA